MKKAGRGSADVYVKVDVSREDGIVRKSWGEKKVEEAGGIEDGWRLRGWCRPAKKARRRATRRRANGFASTVKSRDR